MSFTDSSHQPRRNRPGTNGFIVLPQTPWPAQRELGVDHPLQLSSLTEIVLAVIRHERQLCLLRRSAEVDSGQGQWSVVTGFVDPGREPHTQVLEELEEELLLAPPEIELVRTLPPIKLTSRRRGNRQFLVHPFLFDSRSRAVTLNWEHDAVDWVDPVRLAAPDCVRWQYGVVTLLLAE